MCGGACVSLCLSLALSLPLCMCAYEEFVFLPGAKRMSGLWTRCTALDEREEKDRSGV